MGFCLLTGIARTIDCEGGRSIEIARTIGMGWSLYIGIARTIDLEGGLLIGIVETIYVGDGLFNWNCPDNSFWRLSIIN